MQRIDRGTKLLALAASLLVGTSVGAQDDKSAKGYPILKKSEAVMKRLGRISYSADYKGTGWIKEFVPSVSGIVVVGKRSKWDVTEFYCHVKITPTGSTDVIDLTAGSDGDVYFLIDPKTKIAHEDMDPIVQGKYSRDLQRVVLTEFAAEHPFGEDLKPESVTWKGSESIGGVDCHHIHIATETPPALDVYVAKNDYVLRRVTRTYANREDPKKKPGTSDLTLTELTIDPPARRSPFKLHLPDGYTKTDEFAP